MKELSKEWFELIDHRKRLFSKAAWIPIFGVKHPVKLGTYPECDFVEETLIIGAAAIYAPYRVEAEKLDWHSFSQDTSRPYLDDNGKYHDVSAFTSLKNDDIGFRLVFSQHVNALHPTRVSIHQDIVFGYGLVEEGDKWLRPSDGYDEVIRVDRDEDGNIQFVEIRSEYLRDFLAARQAALRLYFYRERQAVLAEDPKFDWPADGVLSDRTHDRCLVHCSKINEGGDTPGAGWAIFKSWRTDVDPDEEIPDFSTNDDSSTDGESSTGVRAGTEIRYRVIGELWRGEWIEPAKKVSYLGNAEPDEDLFVYEDASGAKVNLETLNFEDVGKYLWFKPDLVQALLKSRGGHISWYSRDTGKVSARPEGHTHFGVNDLGLINVYAHDAARLPLWERRVWAAHNVKPDGGVSRELLKSQMECDPADTKSPEVLIKKALAWLNVCFDDWQKTDIINSQIEVEGLYKTLHRFRATDEDGLRSLAKDVVRYTIERLDKKALVGALGLEKSELGTLKLLEANLAAVTSPSFASQHMAPLYGLYDLRLSDAHLGSSKIESAYERLQVDRTQRLVNQATAMLQIVADTLGVLGTQIKRRHQGGA